MELQSATSPKPLATASKEGTVLQWLNVWKGYFWAIAAMIVAALGAIRALEKFLPDFGLWRYILEGLVGLALLLGIFFNLIPRLRKARALAKKLTGELQNDYFSTEPRENDAYSLFAKGYEKYLNWLHSPRASLLYLTGASGSGKSSLINAYLVPQLRAAGITVFVVRAYNDALKQLQEALQPANTLSAEPSSEVLIHLVRELSSRAGENRALIILDQFEEFFLLRSVKSTFTDSCTTLDEEVAKLADFFRRLRELHLPNITFLLSYRDDFQQLLEPLQLPARIEHVNFEQLNPLSFAQAQRFLKSSGLDIPEERIERVLREASTIDSPVAIRPIVLNILGIILGRMAGHPTAWKKDKNLIRQYILQSLGKELQAERANVLKEMLTDFNTARPRTVHELSLATGMSASVLDNQLIEMGRYGLARCLDKGESEALSGRKWQIAHDFIAAQLERVVYGLRATTWRRLRPWLSPAILMMLFGISFYAYADRKQRAMEHVSKIGLAWDPNTNTISQSITNKKPILEKEIQSVAADLAILHPDSIKLEGLDSITNISWLVDIRSLKLLELHYCSNLTNVNGLQHCTALKDLNLSNCSNLTDINVLQHCTAITSLNLAECGLTDVNGLQHCTAITSLNLAGCSNLTDINELQHCTALKSLDLSNCTNLTDINGLQHCTALTSLNLAFCAKLTDVNVLQHCTAIASLNLSNCSDLTDVNVLQHCTAITSLNLTECSKLTDVNGLQHCTALTSLNLSNCTKLTDINGLQHCTALTSLKLFECSNLTNVNGLQHCIALKDLDLSVCSNLTDVNGLQCCTALTSLDLRYCSNLTDINGLQCCTALTSLDLSNCTKLINVNGLQHCTALSSLNLSNCTKLTDVNGLQHCTALKDLDLQYCTKLTDVNELQHCTALTFLNLTECSKLTNVNGLQHCTALKDLDLAFCAKLTDVNGLQYCIALKRLNWYDCSKIKQRDIENLQKARPEMNIVKQIKD